MNSIRQILLATTLILSPLALAAQIDFSDYTVLTIDPPRADNGQMGIHLWRKNKAGNFEIYREFGSISMQEIEAHIDRQGIERDQLTSLFKKADKYANTAGTGIGVTFGAGGVVPGAAIGGTLMFLGGSFMSLVTKEKIRCEAHPFLMLKLAKELEGEAPPKNRLYMHDGSLILERLERALEAARSGGTEAEPLTSCPTNNNTYQN